MKKLLTCFMCIMMLIGISGCGSDLNWPESGISKVLPKPSASKSEIEYDDDKSFSAYIHKVRKKDFKDYVEKCKNEGFNVDNKYSDGDYTAFN